MPAPLHIITLVKWVPHSQLERRFTHERRLDRSKGILAELDEHPLEAALQIKESVRNGTGHRLRTDHRARRRLCRAEESPADRR